MVGGIYFISWSQINLIMIKVNIPASKIPCSWLKPPNKFKQKVFCDETFAKHAVKSCVFSALFLRSFTRLKVLTDHKNNWLVSKETNAKEKGARCLETHFLQRSTITVKLLKWTSITLPDTIFFTINGELSARLQLIRAERCFFCVRFKKWSPKGVTWSQKKKRQWWNNLLC